MKKRTLIFIIIFFASILGVVFFNAKEDQKNKYTRDSLRGEIVFPVGRDDLYVLKLPTLELNKVQLKGYKFIFPSYPSWSPDGEKIALSQYKENTGVLTIVNLINSKVEEFDKLNLDSDYLSWSPNGEYIAFLGKPVTSEKSNYKLYILSTKNKRHSIISDISAGPYRPSWSPDSKKIAFSSADNRIYIADPSGKIKPEIIISYGASPAWSPDGNLIVYRARYSSYLFDLQKKRERELISNLGFSDVRDFAWSPDGKLILFKKLTDSHSPLEVITIEGKTKIALKEFGNLRGFSWKY